MEFEFITTACNRPGLLKRTYESFTQQIKDVDFSKSTLYINVDPSPNNNKIKEMEEVSKEYFGNVVVNNPKEPNFAKAVQWCVSQPKGKYFFYLEDDWVLSEPLNVKDLIEIMEKDTTIKKIQLRNKHPSSTDPGNRDVFGLPPGLWETEYMKEFSKTMTDEKNPEAQLRQYQRDCRNKGNEVKKTIYGNEIIIRDIGRYWLKHNKLSRDYGNTNNKWAPWIKWKSLE